MKSSDEQSGLSSQSGPRRQSPGNFGPHLPMALNDTEKKFSICVFLVLIVWIVFGQTLEFPFVNFDDDVYVYQNAEVTGGLTRGDMAAAFHCDTIDNWVPLTTLSHMLDCQLYGLEAGGHHATNVLLHTATAILLFFVLNRMTAAMWRSALVAAMFAIHPLGVESVAWISERKDVLSGLFFMLTLWAYGGYVRDSRSAKRYLLTIFFAALGLMSKPMLVTLPFLLLLLDYWPLNRFNGSTGRHLIVEKIPFLALSIAVGIPTVLAERKGMMTTQTFPVYFRIENAFVSYARYLGKIFWPENLAVLYPIPGHWPGGWVISSAALLAILCLTAFGVRRKYPFVFTGWFWFAGMLVPVIGFLEAGRQAMADRYVYLPQIGFYIILTWLMADLSLRLRHRLLALSSLSAIILAALIYNAYVQTGYWASSEILWTHTLACTRANATAHVDLGIAQAEAGRLDDAIDQYQQALKIDPHFAPAYYNLGNALLRMGKLDEAINPYQQALQYDQGEAKAKDYDNLGSVLLQKERANDAIVQFRLAVKSDPGDALAHQNLGKALFMEGQMDEAIVQYQAALEIQPDNVDFQNELAGSIWMLTKLSNSNEADAVQLAQDANKVTDGKNPQILRALAAAYARNGHFSQAVETGQRALAFATDQNPAFTDALQREVALYQAGSPLPMVNTTNKSSLQLPGNGLKQGQ